jgi:predicted NBD/HSP70 family sugar kinase
MNETAVLAHLFERGPLTRSDLRELTGLSKPTASEVLRRLEDAGLAIVVGHVSGGPGPNAAIYATNPGVAFTVALSVRDVGESQQPSLAGAIADLSGQVRAESETSVAFGRTDPVDAVAEMVAELSRKARVPRKRLLQVQIGVPGSPDRDADLIRYVDVPGLDRPGVQVRLRSRLRTTVAVDNDVNLASIAERAYGVAKQADGFAMLWLGAEGTGFAIDQGGTLMRGAHGSAGEVGYMPVPAGPTRAKDFQDLVGGPAVRRLGRKHGVRGETPPDLVANAVQSAKGAAFIRAYADRIAIGLLTVVTLLDPPLIVLAGESGQAGGEPLRNQVVAALADRSPLDTEIAVTGVSGDAVLLGALRSGVGAIQERLLAGLAEPASADVVV